MEDLPAEIIYNLYQLLDYTSYSNLKATSKYINISRPKLLTLHKIKFKPVLDEIKSIDYRIGVYPNKSQNTSTYYAYNWGEFHKLYTQISYREYKNTSVSMFYTSQKIKFSNGKIGCTDLLSTCRVKSERINRKNDNWMFMGTKNYSNRLYNRFYIISGEKIDIEYIFSRIN